MADFTARNSFLRNARGLVVADTPTTTWTFNPSTNTLSCAVSVAAGSIADDAITNAKLANMAQATIKGRAAGAGTGDPVDLTGAQVKTILAVTSADISDFIEAAQDAALGVVGNTNRIVFTYNDASNSASADVVTGSLTNTYLADMAQSTFKGRAASAGTGVPTDLSVAQVRTALSISNVEDTALSTWAGSTNLTTLGTLGQNLSIAKATPNLTLDGTGAGNSGASLTLLGWAASNVNWRINTASFGTGLEFIPSTAAGGSTFTTPVMALSASGAISGATWAGNQIDLASYVTGVLPATSHPALTGDVTTSSGSVATTLATVNSNVGTFGSATQVGVFTVNAKGLVTAVSNTTITVPTGANPSGTIGLSAVNGSAATFLRSDGAPALSQTISPLWTGQHTFQGDVLGASTFVTGLVVGTQSSAAIPAILAVVSGQGSNGKLWEQLYSGTTFICRVLDDGITAASNWLSITRSAATITKLEFGNATDNPTATFLGTGAATFNGSLKIVGNVGFYNTAVQAKQTVTGSRGGNAALASLLTGLATIGLITDSSSA